MGDTHAEELKTKLIDAINKRMLLAGQGKTEAISAIAVPLDVQPRQIYKWLEGTVPHNASNILSTLDTLMNDMDKLKSDIRAPLQASTRMSFPFRVMIPHETLQITQDPQGNIILQGSLSVDLLL